jgi:hypothetical protein
MYWATFWAVFFTSSSGNSAPSYPGFESRQGVKFLGIYTLKCYCLLTCFVIVGMYVLEKNEWLTIIFLKILFRLAFATKIKDGIVGRRE